jgi:tetratricopeptide (TPR) repeat protein
LLGKLYMTRGRDDDAIREYQAAIAIRPDYWQNHYALGIFYYARGRFAEMATEFERVTKLEPANALAYSSLGAAYHSAGDLERAAENYKRAIGIAPTGSAYSNLGASYHQRHRYDDAIAAYLEAIKLSPHNPLYRRNLGDAYRQKGDEPAARAAYEQAIALAREMLSVNAGDVATLSLVALCQAKLSRFDAARITIADALRRAPDDSQVLNRAGAIEARAGNPGAALDFCRRAIAHGASRLMIRNDDDFETLRTDPAFVRLTNGGP